MSTVRTSGEVYGGMMQAREPFLRTSARVIISSRALFVNLQRALLQLCSQLKLYPLTMSDLFYGLRVTTYVGQISVMNGPL